jgi:hypothetical protein
MDTYTDTDTARRTKFPADGCEPAGRAQPSHGLLDVGCRLAEALIAMQSARAAGHRIRPPRDVLQLFNEHEERYARLLGL